jgi:hypothetical protein
MRSVDQGSKSERLSKKAKLLAICIGMLWLISLLKIWIFGLSSSGGFRNVSDLDSIILLSALFGWLPATFVIARAKQAYFEWLGVVLLFGSIYFPLILR